MPRAEARGGMARGDRGGAHRAKSGGFGAVPLGFATDAPRRSAESFTSAPLSVLRALPLHTYHNNGKVVVLRGFSNELCDPTQNLLQ